METNKRFAKQVETALSEGRVFMSDIAENQLFALIGDKKIEAIRLYLQSHNARYSNKLELSGSVITKDEPLSKEQKRLIREALRLSTLHQHEKKKTK
jgi:hypothetical protein